MRCGTRLPTDMKRWIRIHRYWQLRSGTWPVSAYLLDKGKLQVEVMCNLDQVPAAGAIVFAVFPSY